MLFFNRCLICCSIIILFIFTPFCFSSSTVSCLSFSIIIIKIIVIILYKCGVQVVCVSPAAPQPDEGAAAALRDRPPDLPFQRGPARRVLC